MARLFVEADVEFPRFGHFSIHAARHQEHGVGAEGLGGAERGFHAGQVAFHLLGLIEVGPAVHHAMDPHAVFFGHFAGGLGLIGRCTAIGRFITFEAGGFPGFQGCFVGGADQGLVDLGLPGGSQDGTRQQGRGPGNGCGGQEFASVYARHKGLLRA